MLPKSHNRTMFAKLVRWTIGTRNPTRGEINSATGVIKFNHRGKPRTTSKRKGGAA